MRICADYHMHTINSGDGKSTLEENVEWARKIGLKTIAITDHGPSHLGYGMKTKSYPEMRRAIDELNEKYDDIEILLGIECNILGTDGRIDTNETIMKHKDIILAGYHFGSKPSVFPRDLMIHVYNVLSKWSKVFHKSAIKRNTQAMINAVRKNDIQILTHPGAKGPIDVVAVARACSETNTWMEINNSHGHLNVEELKAVKDMDVTFVINSDSHYYEGIGSYENGLARAKQAGLDLNKIVNLCEE